MTLADIKQKARQSLKDIINRQMDAVEAGDIKKAQDYLTRYFGAVEQYEATFGEKVFRAYADVLIFDPEEVIPATV